MGRTGLPAPTKLYRETRSMISALSNRNENPLSALADNFRYARDGVRRSAGKVAHMGTRFGALGPWNWARSPCVSSKEGWIGGLCFIVTACIIKGWIQQGRSARDVLDQHQMQGDCRWYVQMSTCVCKPAPVYVKPRYMQEKCQVFRTSTLSMNTSGQVLQVSTRFL